MIECGSLGLFSSITTYGSSSVSLRSVGHAGDPFDLIKGVCGTVLLDIEVLLSVCFLLTFLFHCLIICGSVCTDLPLQVLVIDLDLVLVAISILVCLKYNSSDRTVCHVAGNDICG